jgi:plastocyanin
VWDTGNMAAGFSAVTTFNTAGTFPYHCTIHALMGMKGTVVVQ